MFKAAIFDLDGTLVDTIGDFSAAMNKMLAENGYPARTRDEIMSFIGNGQRILTERCLPEYARDDENIDRCTARYAELYAENLIVHSKVYKGIREALCELKKQGVRIAAVSNKADEHVQVIMKRFFGEEFFDVVLGAGPFPRKPEPDSALYIAEKSALSADEVVFVGDSDIDIVTAKNAKMFALGVSWGYRSRQVLENTGADAIADSVSEMLEIILK